jgi:hypothetical protein
MLRARGSPSFLSFRFPLRRGGRRADKAHCPDCSGRVVRIAPDDEVHLRCTPRLAARQRGILTFMSLTVVGPGRLDSGRRGCPSTARGRKLRLPSLAGAAPVPRLQDASGRRPSNLDRDGGSIVTLKVKSSTISPMAYFFMVNSTSRISQLSSPRKRGRILRSAALWHGGCEQQRVVVMGPRFRGDDNAGSDGAGWCQDQAAAYR